MDNASTSPENDRFAGILSGFLTDAEVDGELLSPEFQEMVEEVMRELYREINNTSPSPEKMRSPSSSSSSPVVIEESGKGGDQGESCGAFVSDSTSTLMVGVEFAGKTVGGSGESGSPGNGGCWVEMEEKGYCEGGKGSNWEEGLVMDVSWDGLENMGGEDEMMKPH